MNRQFWHRNASTILTCLGGVGVVATTILAVKATLKALQLMEEAKEEKGEELSKWEIVKVAGPRYIPTVLVGAGTLACIFGANVLNKRQQAALMSAYTLLDSSYKQYQQKVKEIYGEDAHQEIIDAIAAEKAENVGINAPSFVSNNALYVDDHCGEPRLFYDFLGIEPTDYGSELGWAISDDGTFWIDFNHRVTDIRGIECIVIEMPFAPSLEWQELY